MLNLKSKIKKKRRIFLLKNNTKTFQIFPINYYSQLQSLKFLLKHIKFFLLTFQLITKTFQVCPVYPGRFHCQL